MGTHMKIKGSLLEFDNPADCVCAYCKTSANERVIGIKHPFFETQFHEVCCGQAACIEAYIEEHDVLSWRRVANGS